MPVNAEMAMSPQVINALKNVGTVDCSSLNAMMAIILMEMDVREDAELKISTLASMDQLFLPQYANIYGEISLYILLP